MRVSGRRPVNKKKSAKRFRRQAHRTKGANMSGPVMRGGIRFLAVPCFHPLTAFQRSDGQVVFAERGDIARQLELPCGRCIGCRLERSRQWAIRCVHEAKQHRDNCFITLTYRDSEIPALGSLRYRDFQLFMKRVRRRFRLRVRFFMCGEYGENFSRPHYHAILFGINFDDVRSKLLPSGERVLVSPTLEVLWPHGFSMVGEVNFESAAYVARYTVKKVSGPLAADHYRSVDTRTGECGDREPEFGRMSLKPGIGAGWFDRFAADVYPRGSVVVRGRECKPPRYYDKLFARSDPVAFEWLQYERAVESGGKASDQTPERLAVREHVAQAALNLKKRSI